MCVGKITDMRCGHALVYFKRRCPRQCETPQGPRYALDDTCASCHPTYLAQQVNAHFDQTREALMVCMRVAIHDKGGETAGPLTEELKRQLVKNDRERAL